MGERRTARLATQIIGAFCNWQKGTCVYVKPQDDGLYFIERVRRKTGAAILNEMANVPATKLIFEDPNP